MQTEFNSAVKQLYKDKSVVVQLRSIQSVLILFNNCVKTKEHHKKDKLFKFS